MRAVRLNLLTDHGTSIQDALRVFLPPIKNDDTRLDFYTVYKKEATEYDTDYVKKYDEDLNTTLIFVRSPTTSIPLNHSLNILVGRFILCCQLSVCYRRPIKAPARPE